MSDFNLQVTGVDGLKKGFSALDSAMKTGLMARAVQAAAQLFYNAVERGAPTKSGTLERSTSVKFEGFTSRLVTFGVQGVYYGRFVEFGHRIRRKAGIETYLRKRWNSKRGMLATRKVKSDHGEVAAHPFVAPAFVAEVDTAQSAALNILQDGVTQAFTSGGSS